MPTLKKLAMPPTTSVTRSPEVSIPPQHHDDFGKKIMYVLGAVFLVYATLYLGTLMRNNIKKYHTIGMADQMERTITVTGFGKVNAKNDIAMTTIGYSTVDKDVSKAQADNAKVMNQIIADLKKMSIADTDLQSDYSIYPEYDYTPERGQSLKGYRVASNVAIKIRDLSKISDILALAGKYNANQVSGLSFTIDDPENLKDMARAKALEEAKMKAVKLSRSLGVVLGEVVAYGDYDAQDSYPVYARASYDMKEGMGGAAPTVASGSNDIGMNVSVTYKIYSSKRW